MMSETSLIFDLATAIRTIYRAIDEKTKSFQQKSGLSCLSSCGKCCLSPTIEAQVSEMLPLAMKMLASGEALEFHDKLEHNENPVCVLYRPNAHDPTKGSCSAYDMRPSVCRLFGFAAVHGKPQEKGQLSTCKTIKEKDPQAIEKALDLLKSDPDVPYVRDFSLQIEVLAPGTAYSERLPINTAIKVALEKLALLPANITGMSDLHETSSEKSPTDLMPPLSISLANV